MLKGYICSVRPNKHEASVIVDPDTEKEAIYTIRGDYQPSEIGSTVSFSEKSEKEKSYWDRLRYDL